MTDSVTDRCGLVAVLSGSCVTIGGVPAVSPLLDRRLREGAVLLDDEALPMAETWRRVGRLADELGLHRPSYDSIRLIVRDRRRRRRETRELLEPVLSDFLRGRVSTWDVQRLLEVAALRADTRELKSGL